MENMRRSSIMLLFFCLAIFRAHAAEPSFDLIGPKVDVHVKRGAVTLPIGETPNLLAGDRLWIHPDFPDSQSTHYVLIVTFLRGSTNQPPAEWFTRVETWTREAREEGVFVTVPEEAQQALSFLRLKQAATSAPCAGPSPTAPAPLCAPFRISRPLVGTVCG